MNRASFKYKTVSQKWVKVIPSHWRMERLKLIFGLRKEQNNPIITDNILSLTAKQGVVPYAEKEGVGGNKPKSDLTKYNICREGDLLVNNMNVVSGAAGVSRYTGCISPVYYPLVLRHNDNIWYYHYIFRLVSFQRSLIGLGKGILMHENDNGTLTSVRMRISMDYLGNVLLPVPPRDEQDQIVRFLDWKISEINKLICIWRSEIKELKELKKIIIKKTITGKNSKSKTKQSGIDWISDIPETWEIQHVKNVAVITNGSDPKTAGNIPVYGSGDGAFKTCGEYKEGPTVLIGRKGATLHIPHYVEGKYWNVDTAFDVHMKDNNDLRWFYYLAQCFNYQLYISKTTLPSMTQTDYNNMQIPVPPVFIQHEIVSYLDAENLKINKIVDLINEKINTFIELKSVIISDVVTGKIDVRHVTIPEYEHVDDVVDDDTDNDDEAAEAGEEEG